MSSIQRKKGMNAQVYPQVEIVDQRGNRQMTVDLTSPPIEIIAAFIPQRSARAEVPGQAEINVTRMIVRHGIEGMGLWARVRWNGEWWDVVTPPAYHHGTRHTRHWSIDLRQR